MYKRYFVIPVVCFLFLLNSCAGSGSDNSKYYVEVQGSTIGEVQYSHRNFATLAAAPMVDTNSKTVTLRTKAGEWLNESVGHFSNDQVFQTVSIFETDSETNRHTVQSARDFAKAQIKQLAIHSGRKDEYAEYTFSYDSEKELQDTPGEIVEGASEKDATPNLKFTNTKFLQLQGFNGDSTVAGLEGAIVLDSYTTLLFPDSQSGQKTIKFSVTFSNAELFAPLESFIANKTNSPAEIISKDWFALSHFSSTTGNALLRYSAPETILSNLAISSGDSGDELSLDALPINYVTFRGFKFNATGQVTVSRNCISPVVLNGLCPNVDVFKIINSLPNI